MKELIYWCTMKHRMRSQFSRFLIGGTIAVALDWGAFFLLIQLGETEESFSKFISFLIGTVFAFYYNGKFSFQSNFGKNRFIRHLSLYTFSMTANIIVFKYTMNIVPVFLGSTFLISLALATSVSMILNFFGMQKWVFRENEFTN